jgi:ketosteroid isomerase-like protein
MEALTFAGEGYEGRLIFPRALRSRDTPPAMSANLDLVRSLRADWDRGDFSAADWAHPEIEYMIVDGSTRRRWTGLSGMTQAWRRFLSDWEGWRAQTTEIRELDSERVLALVDLFGRSRESGRDVAQIRSAKGANLFHVADGKVTRFALYLDQDQARAELGLEG